MKTIPCFLQPSAYRISTIEMADYGDFVSGLRIRETRESIFHRDFAVLLNGVWREGVATAYQRH